MAETLALATPNTDQPKHQAIVNRGIRLMARKRRETIKQWHCMVTLFFTHGLIKVSYIKCKGDTYCVSNPSKCVSLFLSLHQLFKSSLSLCWFGF